MSAGPDLSADAATTGRLRRLAVQIATQLPEDHAEALRVIAFVQQLADGFLFGSEVADADRLKLVSLSGEAG